MRKRAIGRVTASIYTSPHGAADLDPEPALLALLKTARRSVHFAIYSFTLPDVAQAIIAAHQAGLDVRGVGDTSTWSSKTSQFPVLVAAGVDVRQWGANYRLMHDKLVVVDGLRVALGSYNWTTQAEKANVEVMMVITGVTGGRVLAPALEAQIEATYQQATPVTS